MSARGGGIRPPPGREPIRKRTPRLGIRVLAAAHVEVKGMLQRPC
jgi:hypothetical protein